MKRYFKLAISLLIAVFTLSVLSFNVSAVASTGTISFGTNLVKINDINITGKDSLNNDWTITTVMNEKSFTQNEAYSQVGASSKPATSITFTTTLPADQTISSFSAKFGGFSGTAGTVKLSVGSTEVGTGSLNATTDVIVNNTTSATGKILTVSVTNIAKGVKVFYISYTYGVDSNAQQYTAKFNVNKDGVPAISDKVVYDGESIVLDKPTVTATDYRFDYWTDENNNHYNTGDSVTMNANHTFTAQYEYLKEYIFHCPTGDVKKTSFKGVKITTLYNVANLTKEHYTFGGWSITENGEKLLSSYTTNGTDLEFYPVWNEFPKYDVTFNYNDNVSANTIVSVYKNDVVDKPSDPTRSGYTFDAWYYGENEWDFTTKITEAITLTAQWNNANDERVQQAVDLVDATMKAGYEYSNVVYINDVISQNNSGATSTSYADSTFELNASYKMNCSKSANYNTLQFRSSNSTSGLIASNTKNARVIKIIFEIDNGSIDVYGKTSAYTAISDLYGTNSQKGTKLGSITYSNNELTIEGDYTYIGLRSNNGAVYIKSIEIEWEDLSSATSEFRMMAGVVDFATALSFINDLEVTYGIEVSDGKNSKKYYSNNSLYTKIVDGDSNIDYVVINLGDFIKNKTRISTQFTVRAFIEYNGKVFYSESKKTYSIATIIDYYHSLTNVVVDVESGATVSDSVDGLYQILKMLGYIN